MNNTNKKQLEQIYENLLEESVMSNIIKQLLQKIQVAFRTTFNQIEEEDPEKAEELKQIIYTKNTNLLSGMIKDLGINQKIKQTIQPEITKKSLTTPIKAVWAYFMKACSMVGDGVGMSHKYGSVIWALMLVVLTFIGFYLILPRPDSFNLVIKTLENPDTFAEALSDKGFLGAVLFTEGLIFSFLFGTTSPSTKEWSAKQIKSNKSV